MMLSRIGDSFDLAAEARKYIKGRKYIVSPLIIDAFTKKYIDTGKVVTLDVPVEGRILSAHTLKLKSGKNSTQIPLVKKAIVFMTNNRHHVSDSFGTLESLLMSLSDESVNSGKNIDFAVYCQDYRGRGFNKKNNECDKPEENWNDYPALQDAKDQEALIRKLVVDGYKPENILIVGQSYGAIVSLWVMHRLGPDYKNIKVFNDRGVGNPFFSPRLKPFISDPVKAMQKLIDGNMVPPVSFHDIADKLPNIVISRAENDELINAGMSLVETFKNNEKKGQLFVLKSENETANSHNESIENFNLSAMPDVNIFHLIVSFVNEIPIKLYKEINFQIKEGKQFNGYQLKKDAICEDKNNFVNFPASQINSNNKDQSVLADTDCLFVIATSLKLLIKRLLEYCNEQSTKAVNSGYGGGYQGGFFGKQWSARQKVQAAVDMVLNLCKKDGINTDYFDQLKIIDGPHLSQSGSLFQIYTDVARFVEEYVRLQSYNAYVSSIKHSGISLVSSAENMLANNEVAAKQMAL